MASFLRQGFGLLSLLVLTTLGTLAQTNASLRGRVADTSGAVIPKLEVKLTRIATGEQTSSTTGNNGLYTFLSLQPGEYVLTTEKSGFAKVERRITLNVGMQATIDLDLPVGTNGSVVEVNDRQAAVEFGETAVTTLVSREFVANLPLNGRSFQSLLELSPGVVPVEAGVVSAGQFSVNGQRSNSNYFQVDGLSGNFAVSTAATFSQQAAGTLPGLTVLGGTNGLATLDALQEFRIETNGSAPEYGRSPGARVSVITRSGTNRYQGSWFHSLRNEKLDANDFFANAAGRGRAPLRLNQFGGTFGGPVSIPKVYNGRNQTFVFLNYEGLRLRSPQFLDAITPNADARSAAIAQTRAFFDAFPLPNAAALPGDPAGTGRYRIAYSNPGQQDIGAARLDQNFGDRNRAFFRASITESVSGSRVFVNQSNTSFVEYRSFSGGLTTTITPRIVNEFRVNYTAGTGGFNFEQLLGDGAQPIATNLLFPSYTDPSRASASISLSTAGGQFINLTQGKSIGNQQMQFNITNSLSMALGTHSLKLGIDFRFLRPQTDFREYGITYTFGGLTNAQQGRLQSVAVQALAPPGELTFPSWDWFAQDSWRITPRLTLNYGVRWTLSPAPNTERDRPLYQLNGFDTPLTATLGTPETRAFETRYNNFEPRVGLAYAVNRSRSLVVRSSFGVFHDLALGQVARGFNGWPYNSNRLTSNLTIGELGTALTPFAFNTNTPYAADFYFFDPEFRLPYLLDWNAGVEAQLGAQTLTVSYVGNRGRRLARTTLLRNSTSREVVNRAVFGNSNVRLISSDGESDYHALQVQVARRLSRGLSAQLAYTWGHSIDTASDETSDNAPGFLIDQGLNRADSLFDVRHTFTGAATYETRAWGQSRVLRAVTGGWGADLYVRARTAPPVDVLLGADTLGVGTTQLSRPNRIPDVPLYISDPNAPRGTRLNRAAFATPAPTQTQGTLGRNALRGFGLVQTDLALRRRFPIYETLGLEFRAEAFNLFNQASFARPTGVLSNAQFGLPTQTLNRSLGGLNQLFQIGGPRSIQFSLKVNF